MHNIILVTLIFFSAVSYADISYADISYADISYSDSSAIIADETQATASKTDVITPAEIPANNYLGRTQNNASRSESKDSLGHSTSIMAGSIAKAFGGLLVVLIVIGFVAYLARRSGVIGLATQRHMVLRESLSLGAKERLVLVDFDGERMMLGVTAGQINLITSSLAGGSSDEPGDPSLGANNSKDFQQRLSEFLLKGQR